MVKCSPELDYISSDENEGDSFHFCCGGTFGGKKAIRETWKGLSDAVSGDGGPQLIIFSKYQTATPKGRYYLRARAFSVQEG